MTEFETASLIIAGANATAAVTATAGIWYGIRAMIRANKERAGILDRQREADEHRHGEAVRRHDEAMQAGDPTTYFMPTLPALLAMLRTASYNPLAALHSQHGWCGVLAQAVRPSEVRNKTAIQQRHDDHLEAHANIPYRDRFYKLEHGDAQPSTIRYTGPENFDGKIDIWTYQPNVPFQPRNPWAA